MKPLIFVVFVVFLAACTSSNRADTKDGPMSDPPGEDDVDQDGYSIEQGDCDDADPDVNPGAEDSTVDGVDQDCDDFDGPDADGDGHADAAAGGDDCDDTDADSYPGADDDTVDGVDQDCDDLDGPDADGDGYADATAGGDDCDDTDAGIYPGADDDTVDGVDQDCDDFDGPDADGDGYADAAAGGDDCNDTDPEIAPGAPELCTDGIDTDCDGLADADDYDACPPFVGWSDAQSVVEDVQDIIVDGVVEAQFGNTVLSANLDGDGLPDLVVGAYGRNTVSVFLGSTLAGATVLSDTDADYTIIGASERLGESIAIASDLDGDGLDDLLIGAPYNDTVGGHSGAVYVFFATSFGVSSELSSADADHVLYGEEMADGSNRAGRSLIAADIDGDEVADLIIAAPHNDDVATNAGKVYIVSGATLTVGGSSYLADAGVQLTGDMATGYLGGSLGAGDFDGDGLIDLAAGAYGVDVMATNAGAVYVWSGDTLRSASALSAADAETVIYGLDSSGETGRSLSVAADLDGDGADELFFGGSNVSSELASGDGAAYLFMSGVLAAGGDLDVSDASYTLVGGADSLSVGDDLGVVGDMDGDGLNDLLIGALGYGSEDSPSGGAVFVVYSSSLGASTTIDLSSEAPVVITESEPYANMGWSWFGMPLGSAGDQDGDGLDDIAIGSPELNNAVRVFYAADLTSSVVESSEAAIDVSVQDVAMPSVGELVRMGDLDGDQRGDVMLLSPAASGGRGMACIFLGSNLSAGSELIMGDADYCLVGAREDRLHVVVSAGDVDGDGLDDILAAGSSGGDYVGQVYLLFSSGLGTEQVIYLEDSADYIFGGEVASDRLGYGQYAVSSAGDVDGDGLADILLGSERFDTTEDDTGRAYLFLAASLGATRTRSAADADYIFTGESGDNHLGRAVAGVGDVNGDGTDDFVVGAHGWGYADRWPGDHVGKIYLFLGSNLGDTGEVDVLTADYTFIGQSDPQRDYAGSSLMRGGDIDGDGLQDLVFAGRYNSSIMTGNGMFYVVLGASLGAESEIGLVDADYSFVGVEEEQFAGQVMSQLGDVDGDGRDDLLFCSPKRDADRADANAEGRGTSYLFLAANLVPETADYALEDADYQFIGAAAGDRAGESGTIAGDINGDGLDDLVIGAGDWQGGSGRAYVMFTP